jgi:hypothetical protein
MVIVWVLVILGIVVFCWYAYEEQESEKDEPPTVLPPYETPRPDRPGTIPQTPLTKLIHKIKKVLPLKKKKR